MGMCGVCGGMRKCTYMYVGVRGYVRVGAVCAGVYGSAQVSASVCVG